MTILSVPGQVTYCCATDYPKLAGLKHFYFSSHFCGSGIQAGLCRAVLPFHMTSAGSGWYWACGLESSLCLCSHTWYLGRDGRKAEPLSHSMYSLHLGVLQSYCQFSLPEPMFRKVAGGSCQLLGPGPRNGHRFAPLLLPVLSIKAEAAQNQREESKGVKGGEGVWTLLGASLSSSEDSRCTCLTVILVIKWVNA